MEVRPMANIVVRIGKQFLRLSPETEGRGDYYVDHIDTAQSPPRRVRRRCGSNLSFAQRELAEITIWLHRVRLGHVEPEQSQVVEIAAFPSIIEGMLREDDLAPTTITRHVGVLMKFLAFVAKKWAKVAVVSDVTADMARGYRNHLREVAAARNGHPNTKKKTTGVHSKTMETDMNRT
jgi:hypothetical protein